jgi:DNA-binding winged helix-turn-helix (wHTH) protein/predicted ATPase
MIRFGRYQLDATQGLRRGTQEVRLTPKSLAVLAHLAERPGLVVKKDELFAAVWPDTAVTDWALATCIQEIRKALGDDARSPKFVETVHSRGYRFVAHATADEPALRGQATLPGHGAPVEGRDASLAALVEAFEQAGSGRRRICLITGEPGIGKSAVFDAALAQAAAREAITTWAQCVEHHGQGEPYQPLLDGLMRLCRQPGGEDTVALLERHAPMWLAQLPGILSPRQAARLGRMLAGATRDRMLRELVYAIEAMSATTTLVLGIEDLHWSDPSTLDWLTAVAPRPEAAKLLIVATTRPIPPGATDTPLAAVLDTLRAKRLATDVPLDGLDDAAVAAFVRRRLPPAPGEADRIARLAARVRRRTGGNPLFIANVLDQLIERGVVRHHADGWSLDEALETNDLGIPAGIRPVIDRQIASIPPAERAHLEAASVLGETFPLTVVAGVGDLDPDDLAATLASPSVARYMREAEPGPAPGGRTWDRAAFAHTLYRDALYDGMSPATRADLHRRVGAQLEGAWGDSAAQVAAELALHFERGGDRQRAVHHLAVAADNARRRSAFREAHAHYEHALLLLGRVPDDDERAATELPLRLGLGATAMALSGFGAADVEAAYSRARTLSHAVGERSRFAAVFGLWLFYWGRGELATAVELAEELRTLAARDDEAHRLQALHASWATAFSQGHVETAIADAAAGAALYDLDRDAPLSATFGSHDAGVCAHMFSGRLHAMRGLITESVRQGEAAIELARSLDHPFSTGLALTFRAAATQAGDDAAATRPIAAAAVELASDQGFGLMLAWCTTIAGWAAVREGDVHDGLATISRGIEAARRTGSEQFLPHLLGMEADASLAAGRIGHGRRAAAEALAVARRTGERFYEAEILRTTGDLLLAAREPAAAREAYRSAIDFARAQGASAFALRSAVHLAPVGRGSERPADREVLRDLVDALPEGAELPELAEASELLRA